MIKSVSSNIKFCGFFHIQNIKIIIFKTDRSTTLATPNKNSTPIADYNTVTSTEKLGTDDMEEPNQTIGMATGTMIGIVIGLSVALMFCLISIILIKRKRKTKEMEIKPTKKGISMK